MQQIGKVAAQQALEGLGIPLDLDGDVSQETITQAINEGILGGEMQFRNLFDREMVEADLKRIAIEQAGQAFGFEGGLSIEGIREKLVSQIISEVQENIASAGGEYIDAISIAAGKSKAEGQTLAAPDPVFLHQPDLVGPLVERS